MHVTIYAQCPHCQSGLLQQLCMTGICNVSSGPMKVSIYTSTLLVIFAIPWTLNVLLYDDLYNLLPKLTIVTCLLRCSYQPKSVLHK